MAIEESQRTARSLGEAGYPLALKCKPNVPAFTAKVKALRRAKVQNLGSHLFFYRVTKSGDRFGCRRHLGYYVPTQPSRQLLGNKMGMQGRVLDVLRCWNQMSIGNTVLAGRSGNTQRYRKTD